MAGEGFPSSAETVEQGSPGRGSIVCHRFPTMHRGIVPNSMIAWTMGTLEPHPGFVTSAASPPSTCSGWEARMCGMLRGWLLRLPVGLVSVVAVAALLVPNAFAAGRLDGIAIGSGARSPGSAVQIELNNDSSRIATAPAGIGPRTSVALGDVTGDGRADLIVGGGPLGPPYVSVYDGESGILRMTFLAYASAFRGGVRVAVADIDGDQHPEIVTGAGPGGGPLVNVYRLQCDGGVGGQCAVVVVKSFFAFSAPGFTGGIYVAAGDTDGDGRDDIVVGAGATGGSRVQVFSGMTVINDFFAYSPAFTGGVRVAIGDVTGDGKGDVITMPATNAGSNIKVFSTAGNGNTPSLQANYFAFDPGSVGSFALASGQFDTAAGADIAVAFGSKLRTFNGKTGTLISEITLPSGFDGTESIAAGPPPTSPSSPRQAFRVGVADDAGKYAEDGGRAVARDLTALGMKQQRWTLQFDPTQPTVIAESGFLDRAVPVAAQNQIRIVLSLFQSKAAAPDPDAFCGWAAAVAKRYSSIRAFIIGNEVNATRFWSPQHTTGDADSGPRSYLAVLAACYDALKAVNNDIAVIGMGLAPRAVDSNSTKPLDFIRTVGRLYRASGRTKPIMDALAVHPYPNPNANPPPAPDAAAYQDAGFYGIPQMDRVKQAAFDAFDGTAQPGPLQGLPLVIDEVGYQTGTDGNSQYNGKEGSPVVSDEQQAIYHARIVSLFACDPLISDVFFFQLIDEAQRNPDATSGGWQSGLQRPNGEAKPSFSAVKTAIAAGCQGSTVAWTPTARQVDLTTVSGQSAPTPTPGAASNTDSSDSTPSPEKLQADLARLEEALPSASVDGPVFEMITLPPNIKKAVIDRSVPRQIVGPDGELRWLFDPGEAFWQTDLKTQQDIAIQAWTFTTSSLAAFIIRLIMQSNFSAGVDMATFCTSLQESGFLLCKGRGLSARRPTPRLQMYASGSARLKKGSRFVLTMTRKTRVSPGFYFTLLRVQSTRAPGKVGFILSRPYNVTAAKLKNDRTKKKTPPKKHQ